MKKLICLILALTFCVCLACPVFAAETDDGFLSSPGTEPTECEHPSGRRLVGQRNPSCTTDGYTGDFACVECGEVIERGAIIPRYGHRYVGGVCEICGCDESSPQTGDNSFVFVWMFVMVFAVVGLVAVTVVYRKKFANR